MYVEELITIAPPEDGVIGGLAYITSAIRRENWNADIGNDGIRISLWFRNSSGGTAGSGDYGLFTEADLAIEVAIEILVYEADSSNLVLTEKFIGKVGVLVKQPQSLSSPDFRIEREKLEPFDDRRFDVIVRLITPNQGTFETIGHYALTDGARNNQKQ